VEVGGQQNVGDNDALKVSLKMGKRPERANIIGKAPEMGQANEETEAGT
jgi:hypothetical protein